MRGGERILDAPSRVALRNIRVIRDATDPRTGYALVNIYTDYWTGSITDRVTWTGEIYVGGDVTVETGATLMISDGATVHFLNAIGTDDRSDIIVGSGGFMEIGKGVTFKSAREPTDNANPPVARKSEQHGVSVQSGGQAIACGLTIADGKHYLFVDPNGTFTLKGDMVVTGDDSELHLRKGPTGTDEAVTIQIENDFDSTAGGLRPDKVELVVQGGAVLNATNDAFRPKDDVTTDGPVWYGIRSRMESVTGNHGTVNLTGATLSEGEYCASREGAASTIPFTFGGATSFINCGMVLSPHSGRINENSMQTVAPVRQEGDRFREQHGAMVHIGEGQRLAVGNRQRSFLWCW